MPERKKPDKPQVNSSEPAAKCCVEFQGGTMESLYVVDLYGSVREGYVKEFRVSNGRVTTAPARSCSINPAVGLVRCWKGIALDTLKPSPGPTDDVMTSIHKIMEAAENATPTEVGPPISILDIEPAGPQWLEQGLCEDIKKSTRVKR